MTFERFCRDYRGELSWGLAFKSLRRDCVDTPNPRPKTLNSQDGLGLGLRVP